MLEEEEERDAQQMECRGLKFCNETEVCCRRAENRWKAEAWKARPQEQGNRRLLSARSVMVGVIAMLTASLASFSGVRGFKAYDCSNSGNPVDMYSLLDPEPWPDVAMDHVVELMLHREICDNRRQIAHVRLESLAGAENPYSLMQVFGRGHQITRNGATVYVTKCQAVEVVPRQHTEIPVKFKSSESLWTRSAWS
jgi:hypothetical protein